MRSVMPEPAEGRMILRQLWVATLVIGVLCSSVAWAHTMRAPAVVEAEPDGSFRFEALFKVGPGNERLAFYEVYGSDDLDLPAYVADGECVDLLPEGGEIAITLDGSLVDLKRAGIAFVYLVTCGVSGDETVFAAEIAVVPPRMHTLYWIENGAIWRGSNDGSVKKRVLGPGPADALFSLDVDPLAGQLYWQAWINNPPPLTRRASRYGGPVEDLGLSLHGVSIDGPSRMLYLTEPADCSPGCGWLARVQLDMTGYDFLL